MLEQVNEKSIDDVVFAFQNREEEAGLELLSIFGGDLQEEGLIKYLGKWYKLLRNGNIDFKDKDTRKFISMFIKNKEERLNLQKWYQYSPTVIEAQKAMDQIVSLLAQIEDEDLEQDLRMLLFQQASRYKKTKKSVDFYGYLYNSYRYALKDHINGMLKGGDVYFYRQSFVGGYQDELNWNGENDFDIKEFNEEEVMMMNPLKDDEIGNSWVRGITCGEEFKELSTIQRLIVKLHDYEDWSDKRIADSTGLHVNTIFKNRKKSYTTIQLTIAELVRDGYYE